MRNSQLLKTHENRQLWGIWGILGFSIISLLMLFSFNPFIIPLSLIVMVVVSLLYLPTLCKNHNYNPYISQTFTTNLFNRKYLTANHCSICGTIIDNNDCYCSYCGKKVKK